jgi:hypothetical protein
VPLVSRKSAGTLRDRRLSPLQWQTGPRHAGSGLTCLSLGLVDRTKRARQIELLVVDKAKRCSVDR